MPPWKKIPNTRLAYVGLADYYIVLPDYAPVPSAETTSKIRGAAEKALALDDQLAEAHSALAGAYWSDWKWDDADREFKRALELNPKYANGHHWYGLFLSWSGRHHEEAIAHMKRAIELDPLNLRFNSNLGQVYWNAKQDQAAMEQLKKTVELDPNFADVHGFLSYIYRSEGNYDLWLSEWGKNAALNNDPEEVKIANAAAEAYRRSGRRAAVAEIDRAAHAIGQKQRYLDPGIIAVDYAVIGDKDAAFFLAGQGGGGKVRVHPKYLRGT